MKFYNQKRSKQMCLNRHSGLLEFLSASVLSYTTALAQNVDALFKLDSAALQRDELILNIIARDCQVRHKDNNQKRQKDGNWTLPQPKTANAMSH
jgi:hypothetical protein